MASTTHDQTLPDVRRQITNKIQNAVVELKYLMGDATPAHKYLEQFRRTATQQPVVGHLGKLRGYSSLTVIADYVITLQSRNGRLITMPFVVKFETRPGVISLKRFAAEQHSEWLARKYLDKFMPKTLRVIGHGLRNEASALVYQGRVPGKTLRHTTLNEISQNLQLCKNLVEFCDCVLRMCRKTGQVPDLSGTLPRVDHLSNLFWRSRNVMVDPTSGMVWLVDTGWKPRQESLREGPIRSRVRTWFRLQSMRYFRWRIARILTKSNRPGVYDT